MFCDESLSFAKVVIDTDKSARDLALEFSGRQMQFPGFKYPCPKAGGVAQW